MRLAIAAGILSQALPAVSKGGRRGNRGGNRGNHNLFPVGENNRASLLAAGEGSSSFQTPHHAEFFSQFQKSGAELTNEPRSSSLQVECDPSSEAADIGIFSCGEGRYCMQSNGSNLGGICMDQHIERQLQDDEFVPNYLCNETHPDFGIYYECNCMDFDFVDYYGTIDCLSTATYCDETNTTCAYFSYSLFAEGIFNYTAVYCYNFYYPYVQQVCTAYHSDGDCDVGFNGERCNSCSIVYVPTDEDNIYDSCLGFDCTNTCGMHSGNVCDEDTNLILVFDENRTADACFPDTDPPITPAPVTPDNPTDPVPPTPAPEVSPTEAPEEISPSSPVDPTDPTAAPAEAPEPPETPAPVDDGEGSVDDSGSVKFYTPKVAASLFGLSMSLLVYFSG